METEDWSDSHISNSGSEVILTVYTEGTPESIISWDLYFVCVCVCISFTEPMKTTAITSMYQSLKNSLRPVQDRGHSPSPYLLVQIQHHLCIKNSILP